MSGFDQLVDVAFLIVAKEVRPRLHALKVKSILRFGRQQRKFSVTINSDIGLLLWAHARRKLHDVTQSGAAPIAQEGLT